MDRHYYSIYDFYIDCNPVARSDGSIVALVLWTSEQEPKFEVRISKQQQLLTTVQINCIRRMYQEIDLFINFSLRIPLIRKLFRFLHSLLNRVSVQCIKIGVKSTGLKRTMFLCH